MPGLLGHGCVHAKGEHCRTTLKESGGEPGWFNLHAGAVSWTGGGVGVDPPALGGCSLGSPSRPDSSSLLPQSCLLTPTFCSALSPLVPEGTPLAPCSDSAYHPGQSICGQGAAQPGAQCGALSIRPCAGRWRAGPRLHSASRANDGNRSRVERRWD